MRPEVSWVQLHVPLQINVKEHDSLSFAHLLPFSTLRIQALSLSLSQLCTKETSCPELHNRLKTQNPQQIDEGEIKNKKSLTELVRENKESSSLPKSPTPSNYHPKLQIQKHQQTAHEEDLQTLN
jgi:hypothetical protein